MAIKKGTEIATIDCALVTIKALGATDEIAIDTSSKVGVEPKIDTVEAKTLIVKSRLIAQKNETSTLTGNTITLTDNVFIPELVKILQGGTIIYDETETTKITGYTPPVAGSADKGTVFTLTCYSAQYDASGQIERYEKVEYPNCQGTPVALQTEDGVFRATDYIINSAPKTGEPPYKITYVDELPTITK